jgi:exportin-2 (importin alpha re-exporter)
MLVEVCKNPKSPGFNHYLFESVAALIKHGTAGQPQQRSTYEGTLFPAFNIVLQNDVQVSDYRFLLVTQMTQVLFCAGGVWCWCWCCLGSLQQRGNICAAGC